ncbi:tyrosine-type recombinase/integrase [Kibdelosporangium lantanae]|uniref:Tyrosine-type recombinase/integrase n=1 Tax=Kibdelosporangium lantanae TaxID=1497396 RepID=A0ABW3M4Y0_9PSEU
MRFLSSMFNAAVNDERIAKNPFAKIALPRMSSTAVDQDEIPTAAEVKRTFELDRQRYAIIPKLQAGAGLRVAEALAVSEDCRRRNGVLRIYRQVSTFTTDGKTGPARLAPLKHRTEGEYREIALAPSLDRAIDHHIETFGTVTIDEHPGMLVANTHGALMTGNNYRSLWTRNMDRLDLDINPHDLRHFFASTALAGGASLLEVSRWLGHTSIKITADTYGHLTEAAPDRLRSIIDTALGAPDDPGETNEISLEQAA